MSSAMAALVALLATAVVYDFMNSVQDSSGLVATMVASHALSVRGAIALAAAGTAAGPFLLGIAVARTIGSEVVAPGTVTIAVAIAALAAATAWNLASWYLAIPASSSHALLGGLVGAGLSHAGLAAILPAGLAKVAVALVATPVLAFAAALVVMQLTLRALEHATPRANVGLCRAQVATAAALAIGNGANDAQKTVGIVAMGLLALGFTSTFTVPGWAVALSATTLCLGTLMGGGRVAHTLGSRFYRVQPIHGFTSQLTSAAVMVGASVAGGPVSSTQVVSLSIVGAGAAERRSKVRWALLGEIFVAWLLTFPASAAVGYAVHVVVSRALPAAGAAA